MKFENEDERALAHSEGWDIRGDRVRTRFDSHGAAYFINEREIMKMLGERGKTSPLHQRMYLEYPWNAYDLSECRVRGYQAFPRLGIHPESKQNEVLLLAEQGDIHSMKVIRQITIWRLTER